MNEVQLNLNAAGNGMFEIVEEGERLGEMDVSIKDENLTVYHTEVVEKAEGMGYAKKLLEAMVDHARQNGLKVIPLCPYVHAQFKRHPDEYADVWNKAQEEQGQHHA